ncbi:hypothetical protein [Caulobacter henricii]|uniref:ShKT domain-containing protein n=1 Tax=Caulobacter henricii TaxID=69395 RepID=A0A0N7JH52_9CAUL|nr:hypothetical protein [Caulobacter henricii]ALL12426.1 hypothetical protein AQ619_03130 [Caulobacter henricii]
MRRALTLLLVSLALASPAGADPTPASKAKVPPAAAAVGPQTTLQPLIPLASSRPGGDAGQCRAACARSYYFCKAGDDDICPSQWAQCTARCTATYRRQGS